MRCLTNLECARWLASASIDAVGEDHLPRLTGDYELVFQAPAEARTQRLLARDLAAWLDGDGEVLLWLTAWPFQRPDEVALLTGLRRGHGERRSLAEACGHVFAAAEQPELAAWIALVMSFSWEAAVFASPHRGCMFQLTHDELLRVVTSDAKSSANAGDFARKYDVDIYRESGAEG